MSVTRRQFLAAGASTAASLALLRTASSRPTVAEDGMKLGLVTYQWGRDWDLPTLIKNCARAGVPGIELRTQHKHGVEPSLTESQRAEVRKRFEDSPVKLVGYGSNAQFHENDATKVKRNIELTKAYIKLMHDCGGTGVKVKPNGLVSGVPHAKTIQQIGKALNEVASFGADYGQKIRLEVHGRKTDQLPNIKAIMDVATHSNVGVCWNCNDTDLKGRGIEYNFNLVKDRLADTVHVRELNARSYPYRKLFDMFLDANYRGWILLECRTEVPDRVAALREQRELFAGLVSRAD